MHEQIKAAFDTVRAEQSLKDRTRAAVVQEMQRGSRRSKMFFRSLAAACLLAFLAGGQWLYFMPTAEISIDINPSVELQVNRFDRVIDASGYNEDGERLLESVQVRFTNYQVALQRILECESVAELLAENEELSIAVVGPDNAQCARMITQIRNCTRNQENAHCYHTDIQAVSDAHELGLSYGKYSAFLTLQALDPSVTAEEVQGMTMREIREQIESLSGEGEAAGGGNLHGQGYGLHGHH